MTLALRSRPRSNAWQWPNTRARSVPLPSTNVTDPRGRNQFPHSRHARRRTQPQPRSARCALAALDLAAPPTQRCDSMGRGRRKQDLDARESTRRERAHDSAMCGHDGFRDRQTEAGPLAQALAGGIDAVEAVEQSRQMLGSNRLAAVLDCQPDFAVVRAIDAYVHAPVARGMVDGVRKQVADRPTDHQSLAAYAALAAHLQLHATLLDQSIVVIEQIAHLAREIDGLAARHDQ